MRSTSLGQEIKQNRGHLLYWRAIDRARAAMVITELASIDKAPKFVLRFQRFLRSALWDVILDEDSSVREQGVHGM